MDSVSDGLKQILEFLSTNLESVSLLGEKVGNVCAELSDKVHDLTLVLRTSPVYVRCCGLFDNVKFFVRHGSECMRIFFDTEYGFCYADSNQSLSSSFITSNVLWIVWACNG